MTHLTRDELLALLTAARQHSERDWLLLLVTFSHGLRASEAIRLTKAHFKDGHITVKRLKGSLKTTQALLSNAEPLLDEKNAVETYLSTLGPKEKLFPVTRFGFNYIMKRHCATGGIPAHKAHCHALKHTTAMTAIRSGVENARQYLGHKSLNSTGAYLRVSDEKASLAFATAVGGAK
jgi:integrase